MYLARKPTPEQLLGDVARFDQSWEMDASLDAHPIKHEGEVFGRQVTRRSRCIWATTDTGD